MNTMICRVLLVICSWLYGQILFAQPHDYPQDYLNKGFHRERREALRQKLPANSVAVFFANSVKNRANDVDYIYHQDPDFFYLTGYQEPNAVLLIFTDMQKDASGNLYNEILFTQARDERREMYDGKRLGVEGAKEVLGFAKALDGKEFAQHAVNFDGFNKVLFFDDPGDARDVSYDPADTHDLIKQFKTKANIPASYSAEKEAIYARIRETDMDNLQQTVNYLSRWARVNPSLLQDPYIAGFLQATTPEGRKMAQAKLPPPNQHLDSYSLPTFMADLREVKTAEELRLLRKAVNISAIAQLEVMKAMEPGMSEAEIQGLHEYIYKKYGAENIGYPSIVGAGANGCVLHYIENNRMRVGNDLVLMDLGAEYHGYTADVTRTIPANGRFSPEQKAIYDLVLKAQEEAFKICKPGRKIGETTEVCEKVANEGLYRLGIIASPDAEHNYFPHGVSHHIGLDVHDRGNYDTFQPNMILTVEPGIYIPMGSPCDKKWWGIGVRIEDDILITENGYELLSGKAPRTAEEIEKVMAEPSIFSNYQLPSVD